MGGVGGREKGKGGMARNKEKERRESSNSLANEELSEKAKEGSWVQIESAHAGR